MTEYRMEFDAIIVVKAATTDEGLKLAEQYVGTLRESDEGFRVQITGQDMVPEVLSLADPNDIESITGTLARDTIEEIDRLVVRCPPTDEACETFGDPEMTEVGELPEPVEQRLTELRQLVTKRVMIILARDCENFIVGLVIGDARCDSLVFADDGRVAHGGVNQPAYRDTLADLLAQ